MTYRLILASLICMMSVYISSCSKQSMESKQIHLIDSSTDMIEVNTLVADSMWIKLENIPEAMIGDVKRIIEHDGTIYILNISSKKGLIAFDCNGKYLNAIGQQGNGEGEFADIIDFAVNTSTGKIAILTPNSTIYIYNSNGKFEKEFRPTESLLWHISFNGEHYICSTDHCTYTEGDNAFLLYVFTQDFHLVGKYIPVLSQQMPSTSMFEGMLTTIGKETYYMDMFNNSLYEIKNGEQPMSLYSFSLPDPMPISVFTGGMTFYEQQTKHDWIKSFMPLHESFFLTYVVGGHLCMARISNEGDIVSSGLVGGILPKMFPGNNKTILSPVTKEEYLVDWQDVPYKNVLVKDLEDNVMLLRWRLKDVHK